ncbi:hypothetical protein M405DRAFT_824652 [Rhizopogon salebrosus TDB-379]|nr:hypothetical protein M405DRAFT_824652 [Rhizopogon salebrosus TDB-379]
MALPMLPLAMITPVTYLLQFHVPFPSPSPSPFPGHIMIPFKHILPQDTSLLKRSPQGLLTLDPP